MTRFLSLCLFFLMSISLSAQVVSINPAVANPGQTITTTITLATGVIDVSTSSLNNPSQTSDIYLVQDTDTIYSDYFDATQIFPGPGGNSDSLYCNFTIPANTKLGWYVVHVLSYNPLPIDNILTYGLVVADPNSCPVPFNTTATFITNTGAQINWDPSMVADTFRVRYRLLGTANYLYKDVDGAGGVDSTVLSGLQPDTDYTFEVATKCIGYSSTYSIIDTFRTTAATVNCIIPFGLDTSAITNTTATLSWSTILVSDSFLVRYSLFGTSNYSYKYVVGGGSNSTSILGLLPGRAYQFQVTSICLAVSSGYSTSFVFNTQGLCTKPHSLTATAITNSSAVIGWTPLVSGDNFRIRYTVNGTSNYKYKTVAGNIYSTTISGLLPATTYNYQVSTMCSGAGTGYSTVSSFTTTSGPVSCVVPYGLSSSNLTSSSAQINWTVFVAADTFRIRYRLNGTTPYFYKDINGTGGITNGTITGLLPSSLYTYQVSSICLGVSSGYSTTLSFTTLAGAINCGKPTGVSSSAITSSSAQINWNNTVTADTFRLRFTENGSSTYRYKDVAGAGGYSTVIGGLTPGTAYDVQVSSICVGVSSGYSVVHTFGTLTGSVACATPYSLATSNILPNSADISWTPDVTADSFMVRYSRQGTTNYMWKKISGAGNVFSTSLTGLTNNANYQWQVRSICAGVSISVYSASFSFSTPLVRLAKPLDVSSEEQFMVFPNPADEHFNFQFTSNGDEACRFTLVDVTGRILRREEFIATEGENLREIQTQGLAAGIYTAMLESGNLKKQARILIR